MLWNIDTSLWLGKNKVTWKEEERKKIRKNKRREERQKRKEERFGGLVWLG